MASSSFKKTIGYKINQERYGGIQMKPFRRFNFGLIKKDVKPFPEIPNVKLFLVGGSVRDILLGKKTKDMDFVADTDLSFDQLVKEIKKIGTVWVSKPEFLTMRCRIGKQAMDIALPRSDQEYSDGRRPDDVERVGTLREDASRRDFSINALFQNKEGNIIDYFSGIKDLKKKIIRAVGDPNKRFAEDYLRILRGLKFSLRLGFKIHKKTFGAMKRNAENLDVISMDRIKDELNECLKLAPYQTFDYIRKLKIEDILEAKGLKFQLTNRML